MSKCEEVKTATETRKLSDKITKTKKKQVKATSQDTEPEPTTNSENDIK